MAKLGPHFRFLRNARVQIATLVLFLQAVALQSFSRGENPPLPPPLEQFPHEFAGWAELDESAMDPEVFQNLKPDDYLIRTYTRNGTELPVSLFTAYFQSLRRGHFPHSPKNCLPGSGWIPLRREELSLTVPGEKNPIVVNRYLVSKDESKSVVLYWYQTAARVIASEYWARVYLVTDAIHYNRTDTALVRVVVPVEGNDVAEAQEVASQFTRAVFPFIKKQVPPE
jgi:EpsI family protein